MGECHEGAIKRQQEEKTKPDIAPANEGAIYNFFFNLLFVIYKINLY